jgi:phytoene synthase
MTMSDSLAPMKKYGKTFYLASRFLTSQHAQSAATLYAICRQIDDIADLTENPVLARARLEQLYQAIEKEDHLDPLANDFFSITPSVQRVPLLALISGVLSDLDPVRIETDEQLNLYAYRVAGTVGLMMCDVLEVTEPTARQHATDLGMAMQMTNIARDIVEDAQANRRYLPSQHLGPLTPDQILVPSTAQRTRIQEAVHALLVKAESLYESGLRGLPYLPFRARISVLIATRVYREIGIELLKNNCHVWGGRIVISNTRKIALCTRALLSLCMTPKLDKREFEKYRKRSQPQHLNE